MEQTITDLRITAISFAIDTLRSLGGPFSGTQVLELAIKYETFMLTGK